MHARPLQPTDLEYFLEVCRCGSIAQAAGQLGITQPALSKSMHRLEQAAGAQLFDRTARGVMPTRMGLFLRERASFILSELDATRHTLQEMSGARAGTVSIGTAPTLLHRILPEITNIALRQRPGLRLRVVEGLFHELLPPLQLGELDFIVSSPMPDAALAADLDCEPLGKNLFVACVGRRHPLASRQEIADDELAGHPWVLAAPQGVLRNALNRLFRERGLQPPEPHVETSSTVFSKALLIQQDFIGFLPVEVFAAEEEDGAIVRLPLPWLRWERELCLLTRRFRTQSPVARFMIEVTRGCAGRQLSG